LRIRLNDDSEEDLASALNEFPVLGCTIANDAAGRPVASIYLDSGCDAEAETLKMRLAEIAAEPVTIEIEEEQDWIEAYRMHARPFPVGSRWWVDPGAGDDAPPPEGRTHLVIEMSSAFGSGTHESTQLILTALEELPVRNAKVLDLGTGTGILALAADALGAVSVVGLDIDPEAIWAARRTLRLQRWAANPVYVIGTVSAIANASFSLVLCNMLLGEMRDQLASIHGFLETAGRAVLAGFLTSEREELGLALADSGLRTFKEIERSGWIAQVVGRE
jgi:ribosomal protein L11 methyltransferase